MSKASYPENVHEDLGHPTQSDHGADSPDQRLRNAKFEIFSRPNVGPAIWIRKGVRFPENEALLRLARHNVPVIRDCSSLC